MTPEERKTIENVRQAPTVTPTSALLKHLICSEHWVDESPERTLVVHLTQEDRLQLATAMACVMREELRLAEELKKEFFG